MNPARSVRIVRTEVGAVLQNTENGATFSTNDVGARIWIHLTHGLSEAETVDRVAVEFRAPRDQVCGDLEAFIRKLKQTGLLQDDAENTR
jgi:Coenzyme PQQ synthesis protein D (PqqD)